MNNSSRQIACFLSEMSAEPVHGGGITLHRVLEDDLEQIRSRAKLLHFSHQQVPIYPDNTISLVYRWWNHEAALRKIMGCRLAFHVSHARVIRKAYSRFVAKDILRRVPGLFDDLVLVCPQADISLRVTEQLRGAGDLRYISWVMDDHLIQWKSGKWVYPRGIESLMRRHLTGASSVFVVSEEMSRFYAERFGIKSTVLHAPAPEVFVRPVDKEAASGPVLRLAYFGALGRWQNDALELLAPAVRSEICQLDVYTRDSDSLPEALRINGVRIMSPIEAAQVQAVASSYNSVVLPVSFRDELRNMSYFNIATKFSEYMGGAVPTLIIGPGDAAMISVCRKYGAAAIADHPTPESVAQALHSLQDPHRSGALVEAAHHLVKCELSREVMKARWLKAVAAEGCS